MPLYYKLEKACFLRKKFYTRKYNPLMLKRDRAVSLKKITNLRDVQ